MHFPLLDFGLDHSGSEHFVCDWDQNIIKSVDSKCRDSCITLYLLTYRSSSCVFLSKKTGFSLSHMQIAILCTRPKAIIYGFS